MSNLSKAYGDYVQLPPDTKIKTVIEFLDASRDEAMEFVSSRGGFGKVESVSLLFKRKKDMVTVGWKVEMKGGEADGSDTLEEA